MSNNQTDDNFVTCTLFGESFNLRCTKDNKSTLEQAIQQIQSKAASMLRDNPNLTPFQAAILVPLESQTSLIDYLNSETPFVNQATKLILKIKESVNRADHD